MASDDGHPEHATEAARNGSAHDPDSIPGKPAAMNGGDTLSRSRGRNIASALQLEGEGGPAAAAAPAPLFSDDDGGGSSSSSDSGSEAVTSPSVTSPPYWSANASHNHNHSHSHSHSHHHHHHQRVASNMSAESILPPEAITLQDNENDEGPDGGNVYGRDRNRACWAKSVQIRDHVLVNGSTTNIGAFVVWNIRVETLNGSFMNIRKRYSEFDDLRRRLVQTFPNFEAAVPILPPKSVMAKLRPREPRFLEKRRAGLQYFLNCILLNPEFSGSPVLKEFLFS